MRAHTVSHVRQLPPLFARSARHAPADAPPTFAYGETYPGIVVPIVANFAPRQWVPATFGLLPGWAKDNKIVRSTYNARAETVGDKPSFRHAWQRGQLCIIPAEVLFEPCYETGKSVRWAIRRADGKPMGIGGLWEHAPTDAGQPAWTMTMLTINADGHPLVQRFHNPGDEKRSVVILPDESWGDWLRAKSEAAAHALFQPVHPAAFEAEPALR